MPVSHQTVRLSRGKHQSPEHGACIMELASMLAGERFTDRPRSVCPVLGGFLRAYNDVVDDDRRHDLYPYAALAVGTRSDPHVEALRAERCLAFAERLHRARERRGLRRLRRAVPLPDIRLGVEGPGALAAQLAARALRRDGRVHGEVLELLGELAAIGQARAPEDWHAAPAPVPVAA